MSETVAVALWQVQMWSVYRRCWVPMVCGVFMSESEARRCVDRANLVDANLGGSARPRYRVVRVEARQ